MLTLNWLEEFLKQRASNVQTHYRLSFQTQRHVRTLADVAKAKSRELCEACKYGF